MAKYCTLCDNKIGFFSISWEIKEGCICGDCANKYLDTLGELGNQLYLEELEYKDKQYVEDVILRKIKVETYKEIFKPTNIIGCLFAIDEENKLWGILQGSGFAKKEVKKIYKFEDIFDYEVIEDEETITKQKGGLGSGVGKALVGGLFFGGIGALAGASSGNKKLKSKTILTSLKIVISLKDSFNQVIIPIVTQPTKYYQSYKDDCQKITVVLDKIKQQNENFYKPENVLKQTDEVEEIRKYKQLLDDGVITEEEFRQKKKQILEK